MKLEYIIALFSFLSYAIGITAVFRGKYQPSIYSRAVWLVLALNGFVGVLGLNNSRGVVLLAGAQLIGSLIILIGALKYSVRTFGQNEMIATGLMILSGIIWLVLDSPIINVALGIAAHFIGAIPTLITVFRKPSSEVTLFWLFFAVASILAVFSARDGSFKEVLYALYFAVFNALMTFLSQRHRILKNQIPANEDLI